MKVLSVSVLLLPVTACATGRFQTEYRVPDYVLPDFPVCSGYSISEDDEEVSISAEWFIQLDKFKNEYKEFCIWYDKVREIGDK